MTDERGRRAASVEGSVHAVLPLATILVGRSKVFAAGLAALVCLAPLAALAQGDGVRADRWIFKPRLELSGAYDSNFFRENDAEENAPRDVVWVLNARAGTKLANRNPRRLGVELDLGVSYRDLTDVTDEPLEGELADRQLEQRSGLDDISGGLKLSIMPRSSFTVLLDAEAEYTDQPLSDRVFNDGYERLSVEAGPDLRFAPGDDPESRALEMRLGYRFALLRFLDDEPSAGTARGEKDTHKIELKTRWRFFPKTAALLDVRYWIVNYPRVVDLGTGGVEVQSPDKDLTPLVVEGGVRGLLTPRISATLRAGFKNTFNAQGEGYLGFVGKLEAQYVLEPLLKVRLGYEREVDDNAYSNYYTLDRVQAALSLNLPIRVRLEVKGGFDYLDYSSGGVSEAIQTDRTEPILRAGAELGWDPVDWLGVAANYAFENNRSSFCLLQGGNPTSCPAGIDLSRTDLVAYTRHVVTLSLRSQL